MAQVTGNLESQRRQYDLAKAAEAAGFASVTVIDDDLDRSGSGVMQGPGFERLVAMVCSGDVGTRTNGQCADHGRAFPAPSTNPSSANSNHIPSGTFAPTETIFT
jgi:hypothetical protein